jgi:hypothetical protein
MHATTATIETGVAARRRGRPLLYSLSEALVLVLLAAALIATAAVPAMIRHPHMAQAYSVSGAAARPQGR